MSESLSAKHAASTGRFERAGFVLQPIFLGFLVLLVLNDHVLKQRFPGFWTGKLSDVCGLGLLAMLSWAVLLIARPHWPRTPHQIIRALFIICGSLALFFAAMKTWGPAAGFYQSLNSLLAEPVVIIHGWLSGDLSIRTAKTSIVQDQTDLLALPILIPVAIYLRRKTSLASQEH